jgi:hypothetical protein
MSQNQTTRVPDPTYNLISALYHTLQAADLYDQYIADAEEAGDQELVTFFKQTQSAARDTALQSRELLASRLK